MGTGSGKVGTQRILLHGQIRPAGGNQFCCARGPLSACRMFRQSANISYRSSTRPPEITRQIHELRSYLKDRLYEFIKKYDLELLIAENALSIPMNIPLGLALAELIAETGIPVIGHHHDFFWERKRFLVNCIGDYLEMAFPPRLPSIHHVVINSLAATEMGKRRGINVSVIPNVMDFDNPPDPPDEYTASLRADLGVDPDEHFFLQPTRPLQRKGIEYAIELIRRLETDTRLVISHAGGDEGSEYVEHVRTLAKLMNVRVNFVSDIIEHGTRYNQGWTQDLYSGRCVPLCRPGYISVTA